MLVGDGDTNDLTFSTPYCFSRVSIIEQEFGLESTTKIRYKDKGAVSTLHNAEDGRVRVDFTHNVSAITPGQSAVFYDGDDVIGGGFIARSTEIPLSFSREIIAGV